MNCLVLGAGGFIGSHMVKDLKKQGHWVRGVDLKYPEFNKTEADDFIIYDLADQSQIEDILLVEGEPFDEIYQFAADMGGAGFIFTGDNDANIMYNSASINLNILKTLVNINEKQKVNKTKVFYSSSACIYQKRTNLTLIIQTVRSLLLIQQIQIQSMDGRSSLAKEFILHLIKILT